MRRSYYNELALQRTGRDLPTLMQHLSHERPHTATEMSSAITDHLGEPYDPRCVRSLGSRIGVVFRPDSLPRQKRGRGWLQQTVVKYMTHYMRYTGQDTIDVLDYPHAVHLLSHYYPPGHIQLYDLVRLIGVKEHLRTSTIKNMYTSLAQDVAIERYYTQGLTPRQRGTVDKMNADTNRAHQSIQGRSIKRVVPLNEGTSLMIFDEGDGVLVRPNEHLGNMMRIESRERVRSLLQAAKQKGQEKVSEVTGLLDELS